MKISNWKFEGSPEEFNLVADILMDGRTKPVSGDSEKSQPLSEEHVASAEPAGKHATRRFVSVADAKEILTRRELSPGMVNVLRELYKSAQSRVRSERLMEVNGHNSDQFRGLMGAFGRRTVNTVGNNETWFFDDKWDHTISQNTYRLSPPAWKAIEELKLF